MGEILTSAEVLKNTSKFCLACPVEARATEAFVQMAKALAGISDLSQRPTIGLLATMLPGSRSTTRPLPCSCWQPTKGCLSS